MRTQAKEHWEHGELEGAKEDPPKSLRKGHGPADSWIVDSWPLELRRSRFLLFAAISFGNVIQQPQETNVWCQGIIPSMKKSVICEMTQVALLKFTGADPLVPCQNDIGRFFVKTLKRM